MDSRFNIKLKSFQHSLAGFRAYSSESNPDMKTIKAALYDFCAVEEQAWKLIRYYMQQIHGTPNISGSKDAYRSFFTAGFITESDLDEIFETLTLRNVLSHEYESVDYENAFSKIGKYIDVFNKINSTMIQEGETWKSELDKNQVGSNR